MKSASPFRAGDVLAGKYRVERVLGVGGMGVVVAATHLALDEKVALKFLLPEIAEDAGIVARFLREARAAAKIRSEHVARVTNVGTLENGAPYLVMEYLDGEDLATLVERVGPLPVQEVVDCVLQACEALAEAHAIGIVHRDLKPANLFRTHRADGTPSVKVLDFGISKMATDSAASALTKTTGMMGSPLYMSPEQLQSAKDVDPRTDIWALGVITYELLTGKQPFTAESMPQLVVQIMSAPPRSLHELRADVPAGLALAIEQALRKDRTSRLPDVAAFATAVAPFGGARAADSAQRIARVFASKGVPLGAMPATPEQPKTPTMQMTGGLGSVAIQNDGSAPTATSRSMRLPFAILGGLLLLAGGAIAIVGTNGGSPNAQSTQASTLDARPSGTVSAANEMSSASLSASGEAGDAPPPSTSGTATANRSPTAPHGARKGPTPPATTKASTAPKPTKSASTEIQIE